MEGCIYKYVGLVCYVVRVSISIVYTICKEYPPSLPSR